LQLHVGLNRGSGGGFHEERGGVGDIGVHVGEIGVFGVDPVEVPVGEVDWHSLVGGSFVCEAFDRVGVKRRNSKCSLIQNKDVSVKASTLFVEPTTGTTIQANMKLQVNLFYQNNTEFGLDVFNFAQIPGDLFYPLVKIWQQSTIGDKDAKKLRDLILFNSPTFTKWVLWGLVGMGSVLALTGVVLIARGVQKKKKHGYTTIQGE